MLDEGSEYAIRTTTIDDGGMVARNRATMFLNMGAVTPDQAEVLQVESQRWLAPWFCCTRWARGPNVFVWAAWRIL
jgi:hypothetical protein